MCASGNTFFGNPSLFTRIAVGKGIGLLFGLIGFVLLPYLAPEASSLLRWGVLFWYTTVGAIIGVFGVFTWHPVLRLPMPWWFRSTIIGAWMNLVLLLFIYDQIEALLADSALGNIFSSPLWLIAEGAVVGLVIGFAATKLGGEGKDTVNEDIEVPGVSVT